MRTAPRTRLLQAAEAHYVRPPALRARLVNSGITDTRNEFDPDALAGLVTAFEAALSSIVEDGYSHLSAHDLRRAIARGIIAAARSGECKPDRLKEAGLYAARQGMADSPRGQ